MMYCKKNILANITKIYIFLFENKVKTKWD